MQEKKISLIIPVYNVEKYLARCLDSFMKQTFRDLEIICVDDGSTDNSSDILQKYAKKDERIVVITQANAGLSAVRNVGISKAKGKIKQFSVACLPCSRRSTRDFAV